MSAIRAHKWLVGAVTLVAIAAAGVFVAVRTPHYDATASVLVNPLPEDDTVYRGLPLVRDTGDPVRTVQTAASLLETRAAADRAARRLGDGWTGESVLGALSVQPVGESNVLGLTATADNAQSAADVANTFVAAALDERKKEIDALANAEVDALDKRIAAISGNQTAAAELLSQRDQLQALVSTGDPTMSKSQPAAVPSGPSGTSSRLIILLAAVAGFALGSAAALLLELTARNVRDEDDALALYPAPVLARIPELSARKLRGPAGSTWYMPPEIREPFRTLAVQLDERNGSSGAIMVTSPTEGDGKTATAINLAVSLAATGRSVILLDFDVRKPQVGQSLGLAGHRLADLVEIGATLEALVQTASYLEFKVLALNPEPAASEWIEAVNARLPQLLAEAKGLAEYVVIDTAPLGEVGDALRLVRDVEDVLLVVRPGNTVRSNLQLLRDLVERSGRGPAGYVVITAAAQPAHGYYAYGYTGPPSPERAWVPEAAPEEAPAEIQDRARRSG